MNELLRLATALRQSSDEVLLRALAIRRFSAGSQRDFFDLADALLHPRSVALALSALPRGLALAAKALAGGESVSDEAAMALRELNLADQTEAGPRLYSAVVAALVGLPEVPELGEAHPVAPAQVSSRDQVGSIINGQLALAELLYELQQRPVREVGKRSIGLADVKRLAQHLKQTNAFAREVYELALLTNLITLQQGYWSPGPAAAEWLAADASHRWLILARATLGSIEPTTRREFAQLRAHGISDLEALFRLAFPFADSSLGGRVTQLQAAAELLALSMLGQLNEAFDQLIAGELELLAERLGAHLPAQEDRLICQADLTLIAPGPLTSATERQLRRFAEVEQVGLASSYRVTALSLSHGLETGLKPTEISDLLLKHSGRELPQPLNYLLKEVAARFGKLTVTFNPDEHFSLVAADDPILLHQIENDTRLRHTALRRNTAGQLQSRLDAEVIYNSMRSVGYTVVRTDLSGKVISPETSVKAKGTEAPEDATLALISNLRHHEAESPVAPETDDLLRQIQLAMKNKSQLEIVAQSKTGDEITFNLEPIGLANNRLRAKDRRVDIERTLPLDKILRVRITS